MRPVLRLTMLGLAAAALSACSLLSTPDPVQTYRFGGIEAGAAIERSGVPIEVSLRRVEFGQATRSERILGVTGTEAAYIGGARWISPAQTLFTDDLEAAFATTSPRVRLIGAREVTPGTRILDVDVVTFEARYPVAGAAPTVVVVARTRLLNLDRSIKAEETFEVSVPAAENRVSAIVAAFDSATDNVTGSIVAWTNANAG